MKTFDLFYFSDTSHIHLTGSKESIVEEIEMRLNDSRNWTVRDRETKKGVRADIFLKEYRRKK